MSQMVNSWVLLWGFNIWVHCTWTQENIRMEGQRFLTGFVLITSFLGMSYTIFCAPWLRAYWEIHKGYRSIGVVLWEMHFLWTRSFTFCRQSNAAKSFGDADVASVCERFGSTVAGTQFYYHDLQAILNEWTGYPLFDRQAYAVFMNKMTLVWSCTVTGLAIDLLGIVLHFVMMALRHSQSTNQSATQSVGPVKRHSKMAVALSSIGCGFIVAGCCLAVLEAAPKVPPLVTGYGRVHQGIVNAVFSQTTAGSVPSLVPATDLGLLGTALLACIQVGALLFNWQVSWLRRTGLDLGRADTKQLRHQE